MLEIKSIEINSVEYYTVQQFAVLTGKTEQAIREKIKTGKPKLKVDTFNGKTYVHKTELTEYIWKFPGRGNLTYRYNDKGEKIIIEGEKSDG